MNEYSRGYVHLGHELPTLRHFYIDVVFQLGTIDDQIWKVNSYITSFNILILHGYSFSLYFSSNSSYILLLYRCLVGSTIF